jgi:ABC-2 type transport system permease protein
MWISLGTILFLTFAISALALGFGALYPRFDTENAAQIPTSFGGLVFMMSAIVLLAIVMVIESRTVLEYLRAQIGGRDPEVDVALVGSLVGAAAVCLVATIVPIRLALRKLEAMEF